MKINPQDKIVLVGGHMTPALAVAEALQMRGFKNLSWIGTKYSQTGAENLSAEYAVCTQRNIDFHDFQAGKLWRKWTWATYFKGIYNLFLIPWGFIKAFRLIWKLKPELVIAFGGYLALPVVVAARLSGVKTAIHEQTTVIGVANIFAARFANIVLLSFPETINDLPKNLQHKVKITGNPLPASVFHKANSEIKFKEQLPLLFVTGGNQGSNTINWRLLKILPQLLEQFNVVHQVGGSSITQDLKAAEQTKAGLTENLQQRYQYFSYLFENDFSAMMQRADLVLSRAGANTVCTELALGKLAVLIPIPWSQGNEQFKNASLLADTGLGLILKQYDAMPPAELYDALQKGLAAALKRQSFNGANLEIARMQAEKKNSRDAAAQIIEIVLSSH